MRDANFEAPKDIKVHEEGGGKALVAEAYGAKGSCPGDSKSAHVEGGEPKEFGKGAMTEMKGLEKSVKPEAGDAKESLPKLLIEDGDKNHK